MAAHTGAPSDKTRVDWGKYAADARDLFLATSSAAPLAMRMWGVAWCDWMTAVVKTQDQLARRFTSLVVDPGSRAKTFDQMRQDFKQYMVDIAGIPERSVLGYLERLAECTGSPAEEAPAPDATVTAAAADFIDAAADVYAALEKISGSPHVYGGTWSAHATRSPDPLAALREKLLALHKAQEKLTPRSASSAL
jgi:hypothetical protein